MPVKRRRKFCPKFKVGQVVVYKAWKGDDLYRLGKVRKVVLALFSEPFAYLIWNYPTSLVESQLRPLTKKEMGLRPTAPERKEADA